MKFTIIILALAVSMSLCSSCNPQCTNCQNWQCTACLQGYYLENNDCIYCTGHCLECVSANKCTKCIGSYYNNNGVCQQCEDKCLECTNSTNCKTCFSEFYLDNGNCRRCPQLCAVCNITTCSQCVYGFYMLNSQCTPCDINCQNCQDKDGCVLCYDGYYISAGTCLACNQTCSTCTSQTVCTSCAATYYLLNSTCVPCSNCSKQAYCNRNGVCLASSGTIQFQSSSGSHSSTSSTLMAVLLPIFGTILLFIGIYKIVSKCSEPQQQQQHMEKDKEGTAKTITSQSNLGGNEMERESTQKQSERPQGQAKI